MRPSVTLLCGDAREELKKVPDASVHCCVTSPPYYGLRSYGIGTDGGEIGLEQTPDEYVAQLVAVFREVKRVLRDDGTLWLNLASSYAASGMGGNPEDSEHRKQATNEGSLIPGRKAPSGYKPKDMIPIPWIVGMALQRDGWYLRSDVIWHKPNAMVESVTDRPTKAHEYILLLSKCSSYYFDQDAIREPYDPKSFARYQYAFGGSKAQAMLDQGIRIRPRGMKEYNGQSIKDYEANGVQDPSDTERRILDSMENGKGRNKRTVWTVTTQPFRGAHFATFPIELIRPCVLAGSPVGGVVLDPFIGSGTTAVCAVREGRSAIGIELNPEYLEIAKERISTTQPPLLTP